MNKKYKRITGLIFAGVFATLLVSCAFPSSSQKKEQEYKYPLTKISAQILDVEGVLLSARHGMPCVGKGRSLLQKLKHLSWDFKIPRKLTKDEGRALLIDCVHQVIEHVNASEEARPFFLEDKFNEKNVEIAIFCTDKEGVFYPDICAFSCTDGKIKYCTHDSENPKGPYYSRERESYEEAISILKEQGKSDVLLESQLEGASE